MTKESIHRSLDIEGNDGETRVNARGVYIEIVDHFIFSKVLHSDMADKKRRQKK